MRRTVALTVLCFFLSSTVQSWSEENVDLQMLTRIRQEGFGNSKVMEILSRLCDEIGPRLTGSPNMRKANEWARKQLEDWGLTNAHLEAWGPYRRGWSMDRVSGHMISPDYAPLVVFPKAWTPSLKGPVRAKVMKVKLESEADFANYKGKLAGRILLLSPIEEIKPQDKPNMTRLSDQQLDQIFHYTPPPASNKPEARAEYIKKRNFERALVQFLAEEKVVAVIEPGRGSGGMLFASWRQYYRPDEPVGVPSLVMASEQYNRIMRLIGLNVEVELELEVKNTFYEQGLMSYNTLAEIPGTDRKDEVVMLGAHLDSWHVGTGATDNGVGSAVCMEVTRILMALKVNPRRTIRIALWSGEEQGLKGSRAYVSQHFGSRPEPSDPEERDLPENLHSYEGPLSLKPEHSKLSVYFNFDNGSGKIRGIFLQGNTAARPIFEEWLKPFADLGVTTVSIRDTFGTDHLSFDAVGLPGFQFVQDGLEYGRTHHSNIDVVDHVQPEDLMQASVVIASLVYQAAMRDEMMPRKPLPPDRPAEEKKPVTVEVPPRQSGG